MVGDEGFLLRLLALALRSSATLDSLSLGPIDMMRGDPALVICRGFRSHRWSISSDYGDLISWINLLRLARGFLGASAAFASTTLLGKQSTNPGAVDEITCASEGSAEEEIKEDAIVRISDQLPRWTAVVLKLTFADQRCWYQPRQHLRSH